MDIKALEVFWHLVINKILALQFMSLYQICQYSRELPYTLCFCSCTAERHILRVAWKHLFNCFVYFTLSSLKIRCYFCFVCFLKQTAEQLPKFILRNGVLPLLASLMSPYWLCTSPTQSFQMLFSSRPDCWR